MSKVRYLVFATLLSAMICATFAQESTGIVNIDSASYTTPDNDKIFNTISDPSSRYYYPNIMMRYQANDTTLTVDDYYYLYYGYIFQPEYKPLEVDKSTTQILNIFAKNATPNEEEAMKIIELSHQALKYDPFSPKTINFLTYAYSIVGDGHRERIFHDKFTKITSAIMRSGDGLTEKTPWHIIYPSHSIDIVSMLGHTPRRRIIVNRSVEFVAVVGNEDVKGFFFDFSRAYARKPDNLK